MLAAGIFSWMDEARMSLVLCEFRILREFRIVRDEQITKTPLGRSRDESSHAQSVHHLFVCYLACADPALGLGRVAAFAVCTCSP